MKKVITYGTFDHLHEGHIRLLKRAKALGDFLIVGVTSDSFDQARGKINVEQSLFERMDAVRKTGLADQIIVEEYEGQKIDDILRYGVSVFVEGSDWKGVFDYLSPLCEVVYLPRTEGISSSDIRSKEKELRFGIAGSVALSAKFAQEAHFVNGASVSAFYGSRKYYETEFRDRGISYCPDFDALLDQCDAVYLATPPQDHFLQIRKAIAKGKNVLCELPVCLKREELLLLEKEAEEKGVLLMGGLKTAYAMAWMRLQLLLKEGAVGTIVSVQATETSLQEFQYESQERWPSLCYWGTPGILAVLQLLGTEYEEVSFCSRFTPEGDDTFTRISFRYPHAVAEVLTGSGVKSEGTLVVSGTKGYLYVPAPWWKPDYFELRYEDERMNRKFFYPLEGEGIRYEILTFLNRVRSRRPSYYLTEAVSERMTDVLEAYYERKKVYPI